MELFLMNSKRGLMFVRLVLPVWLLSFCKTLCSLEGIACLMAALSTRFRLRFWTKRCSLSSNLFLWLRPF